MYQVARCLIALGLLWAGCDPQQGCAGLCEPQEPGLRWLNPHPHGEDIQALWGASGDDVWLVGTGGSIARYDGVSLRPVESGVNEVLTSVWGSGPDDVWIGGDRGVLLRYDGRSLVRQDIGAAYIADIWGSARDDVWLVQNPPGDEAIPVLLHFDGTRWQPQAMPDSRLGVVFSVWAAGKKDAWAGLMAFDHTIWRYQGDRFAGVPGSPPGTQSLNINKIRGSAPDNVWIAGDLLARYDGTLRQLPMPACLPWIWGLAVSAPDDVWIAHDGICHFDGQTWRERVPGSAESQFNNLWAEGRGRVWFGGFLGRAGRVGPAGVEVLSRSAMPLTDPLNAVWGSGPDNVWFAGDALLRWDGSRLTPVKAPIPGPIQAVWGSGPEDVWIVGQGRAARFDGTSWSIPALPREAAGGLWGSGPAEVWLSAAGGGLLRWDGGGFALVPSGSERTLRAITGSGPGAAWAVGDDTTVVRLKAGRWERWSAPGGPGIRLLAAWSAAPEEVWVAGNRWEGTEIREGLLARWGELGWSVAVAPNATERTYRGLWGSGPDDVWVVGNGRLLGSSILHFDGVRWAAPERTTERMLHGVYGLGRSVWFAGEWASALQLRR